jgi:hypothetical protein
MRGRGGRGRERGRGSNKLHPRRTGQMRRLSHAFPGRRFVNLFIVFCLVRPLASPCVLSFVGGSYILIYTPPSLARTLVFERDARGVVKVKTAQAVAVAGVCSARVVYVSRVSTPPSRAKQINFLSSSSTTTMAARKLQSTQQDSPMTT